MIPTIDIQLSRKFLAVCYCAFLFHANISNEPITFYICATPFFQLHLLRFQLSSYFIFLFCLIIIIIFFNDFTFHYTAQFNLISLKNLIFDIVLSRSESTTTLHLLFVIHFKVYYDLILYIYQNTECLFVILHFHMDVITFNFMIFIIKETKPKP